MTLILSPWVKIQYKFQSTLPGDASISKDNYKRLLILSRWFFACVILCQISHLHKREISLCDESFTSRFSSSSPVVFQIFTNFNCLPLKDGVTFHSFKQTWIDPVLLEKIKQYYKLSTNASNCILHIRVNHTILCDNVRVALAQFKRSTMVDNSDFKMSIFIIVLVYKTWFS